MKASDYRKQYTQSLESEPMPEAIRQSVARETPQTLEARLVLLADDMADAEERMKAFNDLSQASFETVRFARHRSRWFEVLRGIVAIQPESPLGQEAIETLALEKDDYIQGFLADCLDDPDCAVIEPARALRLLGVDDHGRYVATARKVYARTDDIATKREALRALAADPGSMAMMAEVYADKSLDPDLRKIGGMAMQRADPQAYSATAREIVADEGEDDDLRATSVAALTNIAAALDPAERKAVADDVMKAMAGKPSAALEKSSERLMEHYKSYE